MSAGDPRQYDRPVDTATHAGENPPGPYFPEGGVAAPPFMVVNPLSHGPDSFPGNGSANQLTGPASAEWIKPRASHEQGYGVDPNRRWPRQFHSEAYNFGSLDVMPFPDQVGPVYLANLNRPEKAGWSVPKYGEQYHESTAQLSINDLMQTRDPASLAFALGWGYVG
jgi:hypothetical protein